MTQAVVELHEVKKRFGHVHALDGISLAIAPGEVLGLFGHNGAGKSTLMKLVLGVVKPSAGQVLALGHSPTANDSHHYRRQFGYLPENVSFYDQLSGREVLRYFARLKGFGKKEAERLLVEVGLEKSANRAVKTYSKGMRQRLGLAQALLGNPRLLLLDEPTVGLDPVATSDFYTTVDRLKSGGCAVILCSHVLPGVESHIDRAMILQQGKSQVIGSLDELRVRANLPVEIRARGLSQEVCVELDLLRDPQVSIQHGTDGLTTMRVPGQNKVDLMRQLMTSPALMDIELRDPSLEALYCHYINVADAHEFNRPTDTQAFLGDTSCSEPVEHSATCHE